MAIPLLPLPEFGEHACGLKAVYPRRIEFEQSLLESWEPSELDPNLLTLAAQALCFAPAALCSGASHQVPWYLQKESNLLSMVRSHGSAPSVEAWHPWGELNSRIRFEKPANSAAVLQGQKRRHAHTVPIAPKNVRCQ